LKKLTDIAAHSLKGGAITAKDRALLPFGAFSVMQNLRNTWPGIEQRKGQRKLHSTPDSTNQVVTLYQFRKTYTAEKRLFAQMGDGDILEATNPPPTVTTGVFGSESFDGATGQVPASWGVLDDLMFMSNGKDQHQVFAGVGSTVDKFIVFKGAAAPADVPQGGEDYSDQVTDGLSATVAVLSGLDTYSNFDCIFIRTPVPISSLHFEVVAANANASTLSVYYWKTDHTWAAVSGLTDGTAAAGATFGQSGTVAFTAPTDLMPKYAFGSCGFWYQLRVSAALDSSTTVAAATFGASWQGIQNLWDAIPVYGIECLVEGTSQWETYAAGAVDVSLLTSGKKVYVAFADPVEGIYIDVGGTPNDTGDSLSSVKYWNGSAWTTVGTPTDGTAGLTQTGWITFPRCAAQPLQFHTSVYQAYWYELIWSGDLKDDTIIAIQGQPYFEIAEFGRGYANCVWKDRACYTFDLYGAYIYVANASAPLVLNGLDYGILKAGDGRANRIVAMRRFYNELMVWQEELGVEGGCVTIFEGYSPTTFGKILLSSKIGGMNAKAVAIVDGVTVATKTDESIKTLAFWLSRYGVCCSEGKTVYIVSDDIQNYFDPSKPECVRYGYEKEMWLEHDIAGGCLRIGLVSGPTATKCNVFPVFDLTTKTFSFDTPAQPLSCLTNVESGGNTPLLQIAGGCADGTVYQVNYGNNDVSTAVDAQVEISLGRNALVIELAEILLRFAAQVSGSVACIIKEDGTTRMTKTLSMVPAKSGNTSVRHRFKTPATSDLLSIELRNASKDEIMKVYDIGVECYAWENK
jgi:hypothetical protein